MEERDDAYEVLLRAYIWEAQYGREGSEVYLERCRVLCRKEGLEHLLDEAGVQRNP